MITLLPPASSPSPSDLVRAITPLPAILEMDFFKASSYGSGTQTSGHVKLDSGFDLRSIAGKHVLVVRGRGKAHIFLFFTLSHFHRWRTLWTQA